MFWTSCQILKVSIILSGSKSVGIGVYLDCKPIFKIFSIFEPKMTKNVHFEHFLQFYELTYGRDRVQQVKISGLQPEFAFHQIVSQPLLFVTDSSLPPFNSLSPLVRPQLQFQCFDVPRGNTLARKWPPNFARPMTFTTPHRAFAMKKYLTSCVWNFSHSNELCITICSIFRLTEVISKSPYKLLSDCVTQFLRKQGQTHKSQWRYRDLEPQHTKCAQIQGARGPKNARAVL